MSTVVRPKTQELAVVVDTAKHKRSQFTTDGPIAGRATGRVVLKVYYKSIIVK